jgi:hypothetical protein
MSYFRDAVESGSIPSILGKDLAATPSGGPRVAAEIRRLAQEGPSTKPTGNGKIIVEFFSVAISTSVCKYRG